jgi:hypothetical protein
MKNKTKQKMHNQKIKRTSRTVAALARQVLWRRPLI